jgi:hypothetical protein
MHEWERHGDAIEQEIAAKLAEHDMRRECNADRDEQANRARSQRSGEHEQQCRDGFDPA